MGAGLRPRPPCDRRSPPHQRRPTKPKASRRQLGTSSDPIVALRSAKGHVIPARVGRGSPTPQCRLSLRESAFLLGAGLRPRPPCDRRSPLHQRRPNPNRRAAGWAQFSDPIVALRSAKGHAVPADRQRRSTPTRPNRNCEDRGTEPPVTGTTASRPCLLEPAPSGDPRCAQGAEIRRWKTLRWKTFNHRPLDLHHVQERFNCHDGPNRSFTQPNLVLNP
jgi:hypothetical protein